MKYIYIILLLMSVVQSAIIAQPIPDQNYRNQAKYWFYRNRLVNEFVKVGPNPGESLPFQAVNYFPDTLTSYKGGQFAEVGDGAIQKLGHYMGVLATEIKLLRNSGQSTSKTVSELYYALNAAKRLDQSAETYNFCYNVDYVNQLPRTPNDYPYYNLFTCGGDKSANASQNSAYWNGFMIRDDHDPDINGPIFKHFNNMTGIKGIVTDFKYNLNPATQIDKWNEPVAFGAPTLNDASHDQLGNLLIGLRLIQVCLTGTETYNGVNLKQFSTVVATKVLTYMANGMPLNNASCSYLLNFWGHESGSSLGFWINLLFPGAYNNATSLTCSSSGPFVQSNNTVPWLFPNTVINQPASIENVVGASFPFLHSKGYASIGQTLTGNSYYSSNTADVAWKAMASGLTGQVWKMNDNFKILSLVAMNNSWDYPCGTLPCYVDVCLLRNIFNGNCIKSIKLPAPGTVCGIVNGCKNSKEILNEQAHLAHYEILPLLNNVIHGTTGYNSFDYETFYLDHLNNAPCVGPYSYVKGPFNAPNDWASWNLWFTASKGNNGKWAGTTEATESGEYNGLDYMLLYNLYSLYHNKTDYYVNYDNNLSITGRVIISPEYFNSRSYKDYVDVANGHTGAIINGDLTASSVLVGPTGYMDVRAGNSISINPPFIVQAGGKMSAYIYQPNENWKWEMTTCSGGTPPNGGVPIGYRVAQSSESEGSVVENEMENDLGNSYPNPASDIVVIPYTIAKKEAIELYVSDALGKKIATLVTKENQEPGKFLAEFNTGQLSSGIYYYTLKTEDLVKTKRMNIIK